MISRARATITPFGIADLASGPPLSLRQVQPHRDGFTALCMVGSAAGPLAGDDVGFELSVAPGSRAELVASGASLAQGRDGLPASLHTRVHVGAGAALHATPPPLIIASGACVRVELDLTLTSSSVLSWRELIVLGRSGETGGAVTVSWRVHRDGEPQLIQTLDLTSLADRGWPGALGTNRVLASMFVHDPDLTVRTVVAAEWAVAQQLDEHTALLTVLAADTVTAESALTELVDALA